MTQIRTFGLTILTALAISIVAVTSASAANPEILPEGTAANPIKFTDTSGAIEFLAKEGTQLHCTSSTSTGSITSLKLGTDKIVFSGCKVGFINCTGLGESIAGQITLETTIHFWYALLSNKLVPALVLLVKPVHFICSVALAVMEGCLAGLAAPINKKTKTATFKFLQEHGSADILKVLNEANKEIQCELAFTENEAKVDLAGLTATIEAKEFVQGAAIEIELMA